MRADATHVDFDHRRAVDLHRPPRARPEVLGAIHSSKRQTCEFGEAAEVRTEQIAVLAVAVELRVLHVLDDGITPVVHDHQQQIRLFLCDGPQFAQIEHKTAIPTEQNRLPSARRDGSADGEWKALADAGGSWIN